MDPRTLVRLLEELAEKLGIEVRYESMADDADLFTGGLCRIRGQYVILINQRIGLDQKIQTLIRAIKKFDLSHISMRPALRDFLEGPAETHEQQDPIDIPQV